MMLALLRWFEQITEAVEQRWWNKVALLLFVPFASWAYPSRIVAGRPSAVPLHEPVRGFGTLPKQKPVETPRPVPPRKGATTVDQDKVQKLRAKMRQQGLLPPEDSQDE